MYQGGDMGGMEDINVGTGVTDMDELVEDMAYFNEKVEGVVKKKGSQLKNGGGVTLNQL